MEYDFDSSLYNGCHTIFLDAQHALFGLHSLPHSNFGGELYRDKQRSACRSRLPDYCCARSRKGHRRLKLRA